MRGRRWSSSRVVGGRLGVVELVDDDHVELVRIELGEVEAGSDWTEAKTCRHCSGRWPPTNSLAERPVAERHAGTRTGSAGGSAPGVRRIAASRPARLPQAPVVQRRDDGLAGAGGHHHQVAATAVHLALGIELVQDLLLVGIGAHIKAGDVDG